MDKIFKGHSLGDLQRQKLTRNKLSLNVKVRNE